jgi:hypothetical protein
LKEQDTLRKDFPFLVITFPFWRMDASNSNLAGSVNCEAIVFAPKQQAAFQNQSVAHFQRTKICAENGDILSRVYLFELARA